MDMRMENCVEDGDHAHSPLWEETTPLLNYKPSKELVRKLALDLQETLEHTIQVSLVKIQNEMHKHTH